jgi:peptidoglycan/xylan/chitin deacetylase (PgdA/CDA1 family)
VRTKGRLLMWSRSVLRVAQAAAVATVLLVSAAACGSTAKRKAASAAAPTATTTPRPTLTTIPLQLGCGPNVRPASSVISSGPAQHAVALTFDDGPSPDYTAPILTTLERTHTPATFFVVGTNVHLYPALVRREAGDGFALGIHTWASTPGHPHLGIHTWDHPDMTKLSPQQREWELAATAQAIHDVLGADYCLPFWRPPFGAYDDAVFTQARSLGLSTVTWDVDPQDWSDPGVNIIVDRVLSAVHPGAIILLHDGYRFRSQTAQALPLIIKGLKRRGYVPVTLPQLLAGGGT